MKYIISLFLILCNLFFSTVTTFAGNSSQITKELILSKSQLEKQWQSGKNYIVAIDDFVEKNKNDMQKLSEVLWRIGETLPKLWNSLKEENIKKILLYIDSKIKYEGIKNKTGYAIPYSYDTLKDYLKYQISDEEELKNYLDSLSLEILEASFHEIINEEEQKSLLELYSQFSKEDSLLYSGIPLLNNISTLNEEQKRKAYNSSIQLYWLLVLK